MTTLPLFDPRTRARRADPTTSKRAAHAAGGLAESHQRAILEFLDGVHPMAASYEDIAGALKMDRHAVGRRLKELRISGLIEPAGETLLSTGRAGQTWRRTLR